MTNQQVRKNTVMRFVPCTDAAIAYYYQHFEQDWGTGSWGAPSRLPAIREVAWFGSNTSGGPLYTKERTVRIKTSERQVIFLRLETWDAAKVGVLLWHVVRMTVHQNDESMTFLVEPAKRWYGDREALARWNALRAEGVKKSDRIFLGQPDEEKRWQFGILCDKHGFRVAPSAFDLWIKRLLNF